MAKKSDPDITVLVSIDDDVPGLRTAFAAWPWRRTDVELLLRRADVFRLMHKLDPDYSGSTYHKQIPMVFESGDEDLADLDPADARRLKIIFDCERYPKDGWRLAERREVPEFGTVRVENGDLIITSAGECRPGMVDFKWSLNVNNLEGRVGTGELKEEDVRLLLVGLPYR